MNPFQDVRDFHSKFGQPALDNPAVPSEDRIALRWRLIAEEFEELRDALGVGCPHGANSPLRPADLPEVADAIADAIYVLVGTAHEFGIPLGHVWNAVHSSNMAKEGGPTRIDGKILKPEGWQAPDVAGILKAHGWQP
jgi:predicted HAD superfamily Cof-like phosphohydrolase